MLVARIYLVLRSEALKAQQKVLQQLGATASSVDDGRRSFLQLPGLIEQEDRRVPGRSSHQHFRESEKMGIATDDSVALRQQKLRLSPLHGVCCIEVDSSAGGCALENVHVPPRPRRLADDVTAHHSQAVIRRARQRIKASGFHSQLGRARHRSRGGCWTTAFPDRHLRVAS